MSVVDGDRDGDGTLRRWRDALDDRAGMGVGGPAARRCAGRRVGPGRHRLSRRTEVRVLDLRPRWLTLAAQEIPTADGVPVRIGLALRWAVRRPLEFVRAAERPVDELHLAAQFALRTAVLGRAHDALDAARAAIGTELTGAVAARAEELGAVVHEVLVRDVLLPAELRRAVVAELVARREGRAALERARGETAALRALLNAAQLAERHPALMQLRTLQAAGQPGATVVLERPR
jgi:regulator of protease activity HflC (stomatin/prohibitin superfamily)